MINEKSENRLTCLSCDLRAGSNIKTEKTESGGILYEWDCAGCGKHLIHVASQESGTKIGASLILEMSGDEREGMIQRFKNASSEDRVSVYAQFDSLKSENLTDKDRDFLQELEADMRAVDFSEWEAIEE